MPKRTTSEDSWRARRSNGEQIWDECRMNGFGIFGGRTLTGPLFLEGGLDLYGSVDQGREATDLPIDRHSGEPCRR